MKRARDEDLVDLTGEEDEDLIDLTVPQEEIDYKTAKRNYEMNIAEDIEPTTETMRRNYYNYIIPYFTGIPEAEDPSIRKGKISEWVEGKNLFEQMWKRRYGNLGRGAEDILFARNRSRPENKWTREEVYLYTNKDPEPNNPNISHKLYSPANYFGSNKDAVKIMMSRGTPDFKITYVDQKEPWERDPRWVMQLIPDKNGKYVEGVTEVLRAQKVDGLPLRHHFKTREGFERWRELSTLLNYDGGPTRLINRFLESRGITNETGIPDNTTLNNLVQDYANIRAAESSMVVDGSKKIREDLN